MFTFSRCLSKIIDRKMSLWGRISPLQQCFTWLVRAYFARTPVLLAITGSHDSAPYESRVEGRRNIRVFLEVHWL